MPLLRLLAKTKLHKRKNSNDKSCADNKADNCILNKSCNKEAYKAYHRNGYRIRKLSCNMVYM